MAKVRVGIIGAGGIAAKMHLPELAELPERCEIALISGRKTSRLQTLSNLFPVTAMTNDYEAVIADDSIDAVVIATPHPQHVSWGLKALQAGKHVMMQKPLCGDMQEADEFVAAAQQSPSTVMCQPHFAPSIYRIRTAIENGTLGKITSARARTSHGGPEVYYREVREIFGESENEEEGFWFFDANQASVGALFDMGVYAVSQLIALLGSVERVTAVTSTLDKPTTLEDTAILLLQMRSGALAVAETSWCDPARTWELSVHGTSGKMTAPGFGGVEISHYVPTSNDSDHAPIDRHDLTGYASIGSAHQHWLDCIERGIQPPLSNAVTARHITEVLLAGLESSRTRQSIVIQSSLSTD
jgi:predicted dehydrogenase